MGRALAVDFVGSIPKSDAQVILWFGPEFDNNIAGLQKNVQFNKNASSIVKSKNSSFFQVITLLYILGVSHKVIHPRVSSQRILCCAKKSYLMFFRENNNDLVAVPGRALVQLIDNLLLWTVQEYQYTIPNKECWSISTYINDLAE